MFSLLSPFKSRDSIQEVEKLVDKIQFQSQNWLCVKHPSYTCGVHVCVDQVKIGLGGQNYHKVKT
ncbi:hypothetical protein MTR_7g028190 [Medicago truncatula]|uniref:Uncharacterized protein n=1 Tax=Medicago truncatula TaxID=3880 RepID=G7L285_MEDTR|nr:hypothetical protein MTR_7g028190 [Medicago truncatula]